MENNVYYIGGSPCSFKTELAKKISENFGFRMYNSDNHIERYLEIGAKKRNKSLKKMRKVSVLEQWFSDLDIQFNNEIELYTYAGKVIKGDLKRFYRNKKLVVEGCPIIPEYIDKAQIDPKNYVALVSTKSFERAILEQREYVKRYLNLTKDAELAFENWLKRDEMLAAYYKQECEKYGYKYIEVSAKTNFDSVYNEVLELFELDSSSALPEEERGSKEDFCIGFYEQDKLDEIEKMAAEISTEMEKTGIQSRRDKDKTIGIT